MDLSIEINWSLFGDKQPSRIVEKRRREKGLTV